MTVVTTSVCAGAVCLALGVLIGVLIARSS
jgi:hypothetical protein